jgi:MFS family permease
MILPTFTTSRATNIRKQRLIIVSVTTLVIIQATCGVASCIVAYPTQKKDWAVAVTLIPRGGAGILIPKQQQQQKPAVNPPSSEIQTTEANKLRNKQDDNTNAVQSALPSSSSASPPSSKRIITLIRILFLTFYGSLGSIMPYLPVYYHSLGHDGIYIGMLGAVKPFTTFLVAPLWGILSDKTGRHQTILQYTFVSSLLLQLCLFLRREVWFLITAGFLAALLNAPVKSLLDSMVMNALPPEDKTNYGKLRLWGQVGFGLGSSGIGMLLSHTCDPHMNHRLPRFLKGYGVAFFFHGLLAIPTLLCMRVFEQTNKAVTAAATAASSTTQKSTKSSSSSTNSGALIKQGLSMLLHSADALLFFFLVLVVGISSGIIENFAYVRMREVGGTGRDMGISRLVSSFAGVPMFWFSGPLTAQLGADRILLFSILSYVTRFFIYAFMPTPLLGLPAEALRGVTFAAFWSTSTIYAHRISPPNMSATMVSTQYISQLQTASQV